MAQLKHPFIKAGDPILAKSLNDLAEVADKVTRGTGKFKNKWFDVEPPPIEVKLIRTVLITETIDAAYWDEETNMLTTSSSGYCYVFPRTTEPRSFSVWKVPLFHDFPVEIEVTEGKARFGYIDPDNYLMQLPCPEFDWTPIEES